MPYRGDDLTPIFALRLPLGDVASLGLGGADPEHLHGEERGRPQEGERREALLAEDVSTEALEREGQHTSYGEGRRDVDTSGTRSLLSFAQVRHQVSGYRFQVCSHERQCIPSSDRPSILRAERR